MKASIMLVLLAASFVAHAAIPVKNSTTNSECTARLSLPLLGNSTPAKEEKQQEQPTRTASGKSKTQGS